MDTDRFYFMRLFVLLFTLFNMYQYYQHASISILVSIKITHGIFCITFPFHTEEELVTWKFKGPFTVRTQNWPEIVTLIAK